jgi:hypothetical protein
MLTHIRATRRNPAFNYVSILCDFIINIGRLYGFADRRKKHALVIYFLSRHKIEII